MPKAYRSYHPDQDLLLPPSLRDWLTEDHLVYFVSEVVERLNLAAIHAVYGEERRGQPPYDPLLMTKLLVYGYCTGCSVPGRSRNGFRKISRLRYWRRATNRTFERYRISGRST